jgi:hypothetical protein
MYNSELNSLLATASDESERSAAHSTASIHRTKARNSLKSGKHANGYSKGGIVDYTGIAVVHGTPGKPESFLNAEQTA